MVAGSTGFALHLNFFTVYRFAAFAICSLSSMRAESITRSGKASGLCLSNGWHCCNAMAHSISQEPSLTATQWTSHAKVGLLRLACASGKGSLCVKIYMPTSKNLRSHTAILRVIIQQINIKDNIFVKRERGNIQNGIIKKRRLASARL